MIDVLWVIADYNDDDDYEKVFRDVVLIILYEHTFVEILIFITTIYCEKPSYLNIFIDKNDYINKISSTCFLVTIQNINFPKMKKFHHYKI